MRSSDTSVELLGGKIVSQRLQFFGEGAWWSHTRTSKRPSAFQVSPSISASGATAAGPLPAPLLVGGLGPHQSERSPWRRCLWVAQLLEQQHELTETFCKCEKRNVAKMCVENSVKPRL